MSERFSSSLTCVGQFEGDYGPHGKEYVYVTRRGYLLQGLKITGDPNVPRGVVSFEVLLSADGMYGMGKICLADDQFRNQHFGRCQLLPHSSHSFSAHRLLFGSNHA